jgi:hypothetical protein
MDERGVIPQFIEKIFGKNWIPKFGGIIGVAAVTVSMLPKSLEIDPQWAVLLASLGVAIGNLGSKQFNNHSTSEEVKKATIKEEMK